MKRGLKVLYSDTVLHSSNFYNRYPDEKGTESTSHFHLAVVTTVLKRGLKDPDSDEVTTVTPMKRGLKGVINVRMRSTPHNRDEKGTESIRRLQPFTTVTPMKRGLKASERTGLCNRYPDEKGTESGGC